MGRGLIQCNDGDPAILVKVKRFQKVAVLEWDSMVMAEFQTTTNESSSGMPVDDADDWFCHSGSCMAAHMVASGQSELSTNETFGQNLEIINEHQS